MKCAGVAEECSGEGGGRKRGVKGCSLPCRAREMARSYRQTASYLSSLADSRRVLVLGGDDDGSYGVWAAIRGIAPQDFNIMPADFAKLNNNVMVFYNTLRYNTGRRAVLAKDEQLVAVRDHCSLVIYTFPVRATSCA